MKTILLSRRWNTAGLLLVLCLALTATSCTRMKVRRQMHEANALYKAEKYEEAIKIYKNVTRLDPSYLDAWLNMGYSYRALFKPGSTHAKDTEYTNEGLKALGKVLSLDPDHEGARQYFLEFCEASGRQQDAITFFEADLKRKPNNIEVMRSLAALYSKVGKLDEAMSWHVKLTELQPQNPESWYTIGVFCWARSYKNPLMGAEDRRKIINQGMKALGKALEIKPDYFEALSYMNLIYREKAKLESAVGNAEIAGQDFATADQYLKKALDVRNAQIKAQKAG